MDSVLLTDSEKVLIELWNYVSDGETTADQLNWQFFSSSDSLSSEYNSFDGILSLWAETSFHETHKLIVLVNDDSAATARDTIFVRHEILNSLPPEQLPVTGFKLYANYPNPFNPLTRVVFDLDQPGKIRMQVINVRGQVAQVVIDGRFYPAGRHAVIIDAGHLASGVYFCVLDNGLQKAIRKIVLLR
jgi:hypothetical protein